MADSKVKDPSARKPYLWDWAVRFPGDTISTSTFTADPGVTIVTNTKTALTATAWIDGGTNGTNYKIVNHVTMTSGASDDWTLVLMVRDQ